ncbi:hypothetical protein EIN_446040 [Entamoeba invadens IP1]|uniref:Leucine rich repeat containing protein BspA family protein n=1 Tax=Entamoeba invadens IP1 TaxID=370355 RepID=L7FKT0_ENTIV|nr:hypothetical protein EIN_446040 [Entamoeba invadens IP1]ELP86047.1 hypothetical protein EIN_446040 [Entamoeba invadens IP1]|eukprot:XP_004185393.1 hypothetical protein EIN_446040 [Entamoeba invadens IP1]
MVCKKFKDNMMKFHYNPIPLNKKNINYFLNIETLHLWSREDENFGNVIKDPDTFGLTHVFKSLFCKKKLFRVVVWFNIDCQTVSMNNKNFVFKNVTFTENDLELFGEIPKSINITSIGDYCYRGATNLTTFHIPSGVTSIEDYCFTGCCNLKQVIIPNTVQVIKKGCFDMCSSLTKIVLPQNITTLPECCFNQCSSLTSFEIPSQVISIESMCFENCTNLREVSLPESVTKIGDRCFNRCFKLNEIVIPHFVKEVGGMCFDACTSLRKITTPPLFKIFKYMDDSERVTGYGVICGVDVLFQIDLPSTVKIINNIKFNCSSELIGIKVPEHITALHYCCFCCCNKLLTGITIPSSVKSIGSSCFATCTRLEDVVIPESITSIGMSCFSCCNISSINLPLNITTLENYCFKYCCKLSDITIPQNVVSIGENCFEGCENLSHIEIPKSVSEIGTSCFYRCYKLDFNDIPVQLRSEKIFTSNYIEIVDGKKGKLYFTYSGIKYKIIPFYQKILKNKNKKIVKMILKKQKFNNYKKTKKNKSALLIN